MENYIQNYQVYTIHKLRKLRKLHKQCAYTIQKKVFNFYNVKGQILYAKFNIRKSTNDENLH